MRKLTGVVLTLGSPFIIIAGYQGPTGTHPSHAYYVAAGITVVAGLLCLAPWWLSWLTGKDHDDV